VLNGICVQFLYTAAWKYFHCDVFLSFRPTNVHDYSDFSRLLWEEKRVNHR